MLDRIDLLAEAAAQSTAYLVTTYPVLTTATSLDRPVGAVLSGIGLLLDWNVVVLPSGITGEASANYFDKEE